MRYENNRPYYVKADVMSSTEARKHESDVNLFHGICTFCGMIVTVVGAISYWF